MGRYLLLLIREEPQGKGSAGDRRRGEGWRWGPPAGKVGAEVKTTWRRKNRLELRTRRRILREMKAPSYSSEGPSVFRDSRSWSVEGVDVSGASGSECGHLPALLWSPDTLPDPGGLPGCVPILYVPQPVTNTEGNMLITSEKPKGL